MIDPPTQAAVEALDWTEVFDTLGWRIDEPVSIAATLADRHAATAGTAIRWYGPDDARDLSFAELAEASTRFAEMLAAHGIGRGDRVALVLPRVPETVIALLGIWRTGAVCVPIFAAFGATAIRARLLDCSARMLVTHGDLVDDLEPARSAVDATVVVKPRGAMKAGATSFEAALAAGTGTFTPVRIDRREPAMLLYTSGSTGPPKGVLIPANFLATLLPTFRHCAELRPDDVFWPTGDPGWGFGLVCYTVALALGIPVVMRQAQPHPEPALRFIAEVGVTNLATVPTLLRGIMALGESTVHAHPVQVRRAWSCGEPLNAEVVRFFRRTWDTTPLDVYGSSEMGLPIGNRAGEASAVRPGSMGRVVPGQSAAVVDERGEPLPDGEVGLIALAPDPVGFYALGYWNDPGASERTFGGRWIVTNDLGRRDADGYFWFEGRSDDVIKSAGYRIGPFEVESALIEHPAVTEAGVVAKPDALRGHVIVAFVILNPGVEVDQQLTDALTEQVRTTLGRHAVPRAITYVTELPKTETGKIQRFKLRDWAGSQAPG